MRGSLCLYECRRKRFRQVVSDNLSTKSNYAKISTKLDVHIMLSAVCGLDHGWASPLA